MSLSKFTSTPPGVQRFSIPETIVHYILKNPISHRLWKNLIQTCKHFFSKNPILVIDSLRHKEETPGWIAKLGDERNIIDVENVPFTLWIISTFDAAFGGPHPVALPIQKIYRSELTVLMLQNVSLSYDEFQFLTSANIVNRVRLANLQLQHADGRVVDLYEILQLVPRAKHFGL